MHRGWLVLLAVAILAGCTKTQTPPEQVTPASHVDPSPEASGPAASPSPSPTPTPTPSTSAPPTSTTPPPPRVTPLANATPAKTPDVWVNKTGWAQANGQTDPNTTVKVPFQVLAGAKNVTVTAYVQQTTAPDPAPHPWKPVALNLTVTDPTGKVLRSESSVQIGPNAWTSVGGGGNVITLDATKLRVGDHTMTAIFSGAASDGSSLGDKWVASVHVTY